MQHGAKADAHIYDPQLLDRFLAQPHIARYAQTLKKNVGSTTQISVMDKWGNAAALTTSSGEGNNYYIPQTGIMTNNMLGEEDLGPGFHRWTPDRRLSSMMSPTMIMDNAGCVQIAAWGRVGLIKSVRRYCKHIVNWLDYGLPLRLHQSPRLHVEGQQVNLEYGFDAAYSQTLTLPAEGYATHCLANVHLCFRGSKCRSSYRTNEYVGAADARRKGMVWEQ